MVHPMPSPYFLQNVKSKYSGIILQVKAHYFQHSEVVLHFKIVCSTLNHLFYVPYTSLASIQQELLVSSRCQLENQAHINELATNAMHMQNHVQLMSISPVSFSTNIIIYQNQCLGNPPFRNFKKGMILKSQKNCQNQANNWQ